jgi:hypothetical protein
MNKFTIGALNPDNGQRTRARCSVDNFVRAVIRKQALAGVLSPRRQRTMARDKHPMVKCAYNREEKLVHLLNVSDSEKFLST